jgi:hypothetical protein
MDILPSLDSVWISICQHRIKDSTAGDVNGTAMGSKSSTLKLA